MHRHFMKNSGEEPTYIGGRPYYFNRQRTSQAPSQPPPNDSCAVFTIERASVQQTRDENPPTYDEALRLPAPNRPSPVTTSQTT